uniref:DUF4340 domain-containing protein n=1 Tax=Candidatus Kentrum sp. UNK TaxID=2126344 RepID=A0A451B3X0_9GAMM|nr:MAG: protein of unknown function (DUF4340) [Candidatus Kentron sp. UNK]VFK72989.1 MAG: protein of unknown function (DUF4340) [Candidatus Kentron sp. UNK]
MRKSGSFVVFALATVAVVLAAVYVQREPGGADMENGLLFPGLRERLEQAVRVRIEKGEFMTELRRQEKDSWRVRDRGDYPADLAKIHELLLGTAGLERLERKTSNPDRYARLGLAEATDKDAGAMRIVIQDDEETSLADFQIGKRGAAKGRRARDEIYVRMASDPVVWLVEGNLPYGSETMDWLQGEILTLEKARIRAVRITHPDGKEVVVERSDRKATDYRLLGLPKGAEPKSVYTVNSIASDMARLRLQDVRSIEDVGLSKGKPGAKVLLTTFDGMRVAMETWQVGEDVFSRFDAGFDAALVAPVAKSDESQQERKTEKIAIAGKDTEKGSGEGEKEPPTTKPKQRYDAASVKKEADELAEQWRDWVYILPKYRLNSLTRRMSDLIKEPGAKSDES